MANKYLEKIAILHIPIGAIAADSGDRIGGGIIGGTLGAAAGGGLGAAVGGAPGAAIGYFTGSYLGGKAYSRVKDGFRSEAEMKKHIERNK